MQLTQIQNLEGTITLKTGLDPRDSDIGDAKKYWKQWPAKDAA